MKYAVLLMAAMAAAAQEPPECLKCHGNVQNALQKKVRHAAMEGGCETCHVNHRPRPAPGSAAASEHYLNAKQPDLCLTCHDVKDKALAAAHRGQPFETSVCSGCHDPHSSDEAKLIPATQHGPYAVRECGGCHQAPQNGKVRLTAASASELCFSCHEDMRTQTATAKHQHALMKADPNSCVDCHDPHAGNRRHLLKKPMPALCNDCHSGLTEGKDCVHEPVALSCTICHAAHASNVKLQLLAEPNDLCLECHGPNALRILQAQGPVTLFGGRVNLPPKPFAELKWVQLNKDNTRGHPFPNHPVSAPAAKGKPALACLSCHQPHAAKASTRLFVTEQPNESLLCVRCH